MDFARLQTACRVRRSQETGPEGGVRRRRQAARIVRRLPAWPMMQTIRFDAARRSRPGLARAGASMRRHRLRRVIRTGTILVRKHPDFGARC